MTAAQKRKQRLDQLQREFKRRLEAGRSTEPPFIKMRGLIVQQLRSENRQDKKRTA